MSNQGSIQPPLANAARAAYERWKLAFSLSKAPWEDLSLDMQNRWIHIADAAIEGLREAHGRS
jgi:hypothetical protein